MFTLRLTGCSGTEAFWEKRIGLKLYVKQVTLSVGHTQSQNYSLSTATKSNFTLMYSVNLKVFHPIIIQRLV